MIIGKVNVDGTIYEEEFQTVSEALKGEMKLYFSTGCDYDFYYNGVLMDKPKNERDMSFSDIADYYLDYIAAIDKFGVSENTDFLNSYFI